MTHAIEKKVEEMGFSLPEPTIPLANYVPYVISGGQVIISGQLPLLNGKPQGIGKLGREFTVEQGQQFARICGVNLLSQLRAAVGGDWGKVKRCLRLGVFVSSAEGFTDQPKVANGVSDMMVELFGDKGKHARAAVGVAELPLGVCVEVDAVFEIG